ncbi:hypothetical protein CDAR_546861 [Caerostris darwini]|uniref:Uncharacterized protein n=1 Tax=Caerostris darwini TaxID=1538125 RepID=A0AAV4W830_9ARAC|nr:hypothetical protein CDAR_546861 [Caerostris darwini]
MPDLNLQKNSKKISNTTSVKQEQEKNYSKKEYEEYLEKLFHVDVLKDGSAQNEFLNDNNKGKKKHKRSSSSEKVQQKKMIANSDDELFSISSLETDLEENEQPSQKRASGLLADFFD